MPTSSQVALQAIAIVKKLTDIRNARDGAHESSQDLGPDENGNPSWMTFCPAHKDSEHPSLHISFHDKVLFKCRAGCSQDSILTKLKELGLWGKDVNIKFIVNNPAHEEPADEILYDFILDENGTTPNIVYSYRDKDNRPVFWVLRANKTKEREKIIKPLCSVTYLESGEKKFIQVHFPDNRPLYNLPFVISSQAIVVYEGEKACDASHNFFPSLCATTWSGGSGNLMKSDWTPLHGKKIILFPDNDKSGIEAMEKIATLILSRDPKTSIKIVFREEQKDLPKGWDIADCADGDNTPQILLSAAQDFTREDITGPIPSDLKACIADYNNRLIPIAQGDKILLVDISKPGRGSNTTIPFSNYMAHGEVCYMIENDKVFLSGSKKPVYAIDEWLEMSKERIHIGITYDPSKAVHTLVEQGQKIFNIFHGFYSKPEKGLGHQLFNDHIAMMLANNTDYFLDWIAHMVQKPKEKPGTFMLLTGPEGTGKSLIGQLICNLLGENNAIQIRTNDLQSSFNAALSSKLFCYIDEFYLENTFNKHFNDDFKSLLTTDRLQINQKYMVPRNEPSYHRFMGTTNQRVPYKIDFNTRRDIIFDVRAHKYTKDTNYFAKFADIMFNKLALNSWMDYLLCRDIKNNIRSAPVTKAREAMYSPTDPVAKFLYVILHEGMFPEEFNVYYVKNDPNCLTNRWPNSKVYLPREAVRKFIRKEYGTDISAVSITNRLLELTRTEETRKTIQIRFEVKERGNLSELRNDAFIFLPLNKLRELFNERMNLHINWNEVGTEEELEPKESNIIPFKKDIF